MSKVITFSRTFPAYHPKAGEKTFFVEQILNSIGGIETARDLLPGVHEIINELFLFGANTLYKHHTIRAGSRFKVGDKFSPRVWSGKPYNSKQIIIAPDIEVKKVFSFEILNNLFFIDGESFVIDDEVLLTKIAENDGLELQDLLDWFKYPKDSGKMQIICWNDSIQY